MDNKNYKLSRREVKRVGHTIIGICLVVGGVLLSGFATGKAIVFPLSILSVALVVYGIIEIRAALRS